MTQLREPLLYTEQKCRLFVDQLCGGDKFIAIDIDLEVWLLVSAAAAGWLSHQVHLLHLGESWPVIKQKWQQTTEHKARSPHYLTDRRH